MPDFLRATERAAKSVRHMSHYLAESLHEARSGFSDSEAGDYLTSAAVPPDVAAETDPAATPKPAAGSDPNSSSDAELLERAAFLIGTGVDMFDALNAENVISKWSFMPFIGNAVDAAITLVDLARDIIPQLRDRAAQFAAIELDEQST